MPGNTESLYYSFNIGHFISISTEFYFFTDYGLELIDHQYAWLENDLKEAAAPENRTFRPWIFLMGHRPMYCSNTDHDDCTMHESRVRTGIPELNKPGLEDILYKYGADVLIWAHEHSYEKLFPVYNQQVGLLQGEQGVCIIDSNFSNYRFRFSMPGNTESLYYSFNIGPVHLISISTEFYFFTDYGLELIDHQYAWLENDLKEAAAPENRTLRPWIFLMGHRPMYCSNTDHDDCTMHESRVRTGIPELNKPGLEDILYKYGKD
ncbi:predicted protein [Nematostella vectensis]|uniref:Calcineurin-like phosphoesterase domain-containing protein n=1 Tax=Nematostella vectensis TaxID=45351 RepID=A7S4Y5_NEMVE|nr:predicted protein [Nematostella vectensis]|eukprot:XP_001633296.1 predicted protein [Nematostella vectensis]